MAEKLYVEAIRDALAEEMANDETIIVMGLDVELGYVFQATTGLIDKFGADRVRDMPLSEPTIVGAGVGAAIGGLRPVVEIQFHDFVTLAMDQIANQAAKYHFMTGGQAKVPLIVRMPMGYLGSWSAQHSQCLHAWFAHIPGLRVVLPSCPADAYGLLKESLRQDNPVIFLEHKQLYKTKGHVPEGDYTIPFGMADVKRRGSDVTVVALSLMVNRALEAADILAQDSIDVCVIDPRTISPLDDETIIASVKQTGRLVIVDEGCCSFGASAEIAARVAEKALDYLDAPILRVCVPDVPIPFSDVLEAEVIPSVEKIKSAILEVLKS